jgi:hypothetical protein
LASHKGPEYRRPFLTRAGQILQTALTGMFRITIGRSPTHPMNTNVPLGHLPHPLAYRLFRTKFAQQVGAHPDLRADPYRRYYELQANSMYIHANLLQAGGRVFTNFLRLPLNGSAPFATCRF